MPARNNQADTAMTAPTTPRDPFTDEARNAVDAILDSHVFSREQLAKASADLARRTWNEAIEAAAKLADKADEKDARDYGAAASGAAWQLGIAIRALKRPEAP